MLTLLDDVSHLAKAAICNIPILYQLRKSSWTIGSSYMRSTVPKFSNWESEDNVPYALHFDGGKTISPNDPQENPEMFPNTNPAPIAPAPAPPLKPRTGPEEPTGRVHEQRPIGEDGDLRQFNKSPAWNRKNYDNSGHGRSRLKPATRGDESPDECAAVPRFGEWDENDPQSAENFTGIFNKVREERNSNGAANAFGTPQLPPYVTRGQPANKPKKCCFPWW